MCGIAGIAHVRSDEPVDVSRLHRMSRLMRHRGPDDEGLVLIDPDHGTAMTLAGPDTTADVLASNHPYAPGRMVRPRGQNGRPEPRFRVGLAGRRLAILDLTPAGHQPMCDADGSWIVFNGEIYNYVELRADLERLGHRFASAGDTEVILTAYRQYGLDALGRMNGMFALALWDARRRTLVCARDRFGVKPLYYQWDGARFAFASEPKALVRTQADPVRPRLDAVRDLLALDWVDHEAHTFFEGVWQLPAGHVLELGPRGFALTRWWALDPTRRATGSRAEWTAEFDRLFTDAVTIRMRSDVEVGSCLSGGIDSSAVVATAAPLVPHPIHTFSCAYDEGPAYDERPYVRAVVEATGATMHLVVPDGGDFWTVFDRLTDVQDEPTAGPGLYSQWKVMELAHRAGLKVLLDGQGGDETLAGYFRYLPIRLRDLLVEGRIGAFLALWGPVADRLGAATTLALVVEPWLPKPAVAALRRRFGQGKDRVLAPSLAARGMPPPAPPPGFPSALSRQLAFDTLRRLLPSLLRYEDRNSMAFSIETRLPFLDYRLVEHVFSLPDEERLDGTTTKAILRRAVQGRVPRAVLDRRDKMGFETPTDVWLRGRYANEVRRRLLAPGPLHEWVEPSTLAEELEDYLGQRRAIGLQVWRWLSLDSWARRFVAADPRLGARENATRETWPRGAWPPVAARAGARAGVA